MDDAVVVQIGDGGKSCSNEIGSVGLVVVSLAADAVEQFAAKRKVGDKVD